MSENVPLPDKHDPFGLQRAHPLTCSFLTPHAFREANGRTFTYGRASFRPTRFCACTTACL